MYIHSEDIHNKKAAEVVIPLILKEIQVKSVLDVGCGTGTWLKVFMDQGVVDILGLDGSYINYDKLLIDTKYFKEADLNYPFSIGRKFDLILCLEVAEHILESSVDDLVSSLCYHSDTIIFSAAIPGQGGQNHLNERWPEYWQEKFKKYGFYFHDIIRPLIWNNNDVDWWYKQNIFLITQENSREIIKSVVHPDCLAHKIKYYERLNQAIVQGKLGALESFKIFLRSMKIRFNSK